jgi:colicin import membrane protein
VIRDQYNIIPITMAGIFHLVIAASLVFAIDFSRRSFPVVPLMMQATLVTEDNMPLPVEDPLPPVEEPPDTAEEDRLRAEEERRQADLKAEQDRIRLQQLKDRQRRDQEVADRKARAEAEVERRRELAERKRQEDIEKQRLENERRRQEAEEEEIRRQRQVEIDTENRRLERMQADDTARWVYAIQQKIGRYTILPASKPEDLECVVDVRQLPGGRVVDVQIGRCNGDESVRRAIEAGVYKASPIPAPDNPAIFDRNLRITFKPEQ